MVAWAESTKKQNDSRSQNIVIEMIKTEFDIFKQQTFQIVSVSKGRELKIYVEERKE